MHNNKKSITLPKELEPFCHTVTSVDADQKKIQLPYLSRGEKQWYPYGGSLNRFFVMIIRRDMENVWYCIGFGKIETSGVN